MTHSVTGSCRSASCAALALFAMPLAAQDQPQVVTGNDPNVREIATTPIRDLNLTRDEIPAILLQAAAAPYAADELDSCARIGAAIAQLDQVLGDDLDVQADEGDNVSVGRIARSAVGSLVPFRSIVRELTGAAAHQRAFEEAILAGAVRRGYLKGLGQQRGCAYPARPAFANVRVTATDETPGTVNAPQVARTERRATDGTTFVSQPVVQGDK